MFQVTEKAKEMIGDFFKDKEGVPYVRIFLAEGGWSGPSLAMALDEPKENDEIIKENKITYLINKELYEKAQPISVDFIESPMGSGFSLSSALNTGGSCGTSCSTC